MFEKGNKGQVERPVKGLIFHYPCYFAPPITQIRQGDYKYMKHLLTGEVKLFNVNTDYAEKNDLSKTMPEKVAEMDKALSSYLVGIDAEDVQEVYQARFEELDKFEAQSKANAEKAIAKANGDAAAVARAKERLKADQERFDKNRAEVRRNMKGTHWSGAAPEE